MFRSICILSLFVLSAHAASLSPAEVMTTAKDIAQHVVGAVSSCLKQNGVELSTITSLNGLKKPLTCFLQCVLHLAGVTTEKGTLNGPALMAVTAMAPPVQKFMETVVKDCSNQDAGNPCDSAVKTVHCVAHEQIVKTQVGRMAMKGIGGLKLLFL